ncbi:unnamed protein product [Coccothraustes coccothraustes]
MVFLQSYHKENGFTLCWHNTETKELKSQFQLLLSHSDIDYNLKNLNNSLMRLDPLSLVIEMYFPMVLQNFRSIFCKQQMMRTFLAYDGEFSQSESWSTLDAAKTLKKRNYRIPHLKINPKVDP